MSLTRDRKPVKVLQYIGQWIDVTRYIVHKDGTLQYVHPDTGHRYLARTGNWRKVKRRGLVEKAKGK